LSLTSETQEFAPFDETGSVSLGEVYQTLSRRIVKRAINRARDLLREEVRSASVGSTISHPGHRGSAADKIDADMDEVLEGLVKTYSPNALFLSEERHRTFHPRARQIVARADPVDGTKNALRLFSAYAVAVYFERVSRDADHLTHLAGAIATAHGEVVSWCKHRHGGEVLIEWPKTLPWDESESDQDDGVVEGDFAVHLVRENEQLHAPGLRPGVAQAVAAVATTEERRNLPLFKKLGLEQAANELWVSTCGGNPMIAPLLLGDLGAIIEPKEDVSVDDALYLIPLALAGGEVMGASGESMEVFEPFRAFNEEERRIGPFVATIGQDSKRFWRARLRGAAQ
jgi:hypothetical protein